MMPQDINQRIFPQPAVVPGCENSEDNMKTKCSSDGLDSIDATLPGEHLSSCDVDDISVKQTSGSHEASSDSSDDQGVSLSEPLAQVTSEAAADLEADMGYGSRGSPRGFLQTNCAEQDSCASGQFSEQEDTPTMMQYETSSSQSEELLFHFDRFFRRRFESELDEFKESMEDMFSEQQIHLKQILLKCGCDEAPACQVDEIELSPYNPTAVSEDTVESTSISSNDQSEVARQSRSALLIGMLTATCRLVSRLQSTDFGL